DRQQFFPADWTLIHGFSPAAAVVPPLAAASHSGSLSIVSRITALPRWPYFSPVTWHSNFSPTRSPTALAIAASIASTGTLLSSFSYSTACPPGFADAGTAHFLAPKPAVQPQHLLPTNRVQNR